MANHSDMAMPATRRLGVHDEEGFLVGLLVQLIWLETLRRGLTTVRAVTDLNGVVAG